jgi:23S rRNA pseudouridine2605 synthase
MERLQKVIAQAGVASRRKAEELISQGKVTVNGKTVKEMGIQVGPEDKIAVNGVPLKQEEKVYYLLNKPKHTISSVSDDKGRDTVLDCFGSTSERIFPIGRLDYETTGLLLLTNDGEFANLMMHPRSHIRKTYECAVDGILDDSMCAKLEHGIMLEDGRTLPAEVSILQRSEKKNKTVLLITIQEGRNREIRRMMEYFHCEVTRLNRVQYAFLDLGNLRQGQYRKLRSYEVKKLKACADDHSSAMPKR